MISLPLRLRLPLPVRVLAGVALLLAAFVLAVVERDDDRAGRSPATRWNAVEDDTSVTDSLDETPEADAGGHPTGDAQLRSAARAAPGVWGERTLPAGQQGGASVGGPAEVRTWFVRALGAQGPPLRAG